TFTSTYYDTTEHRLARHRIALCRRRAGKETRWDLVLFGHPARPVMPCAERSLHPPSTIRDALFAHLRGDELAPMFKFRTRRTGIQVSDGERTLATIVFDTITQLDGRRVVRRFSELTIEPIDADESALSRIETVLRSAGAVDGDEQPAIFRAIGLEIPPRQPAMPPAAPTIDHLKAKFAAEVEAILAHDPVTRLGVDPEDLHQMRVSTRRLRAILRAAKAMLVAEWADGLRAELAWLGEALGRVRDLDVLLHRFHNESAALDPLERRAFERLLVSLEAERAEARAAMLGGLRSDRYLQLLDRLRAAADAPETVPSTLSLRDLAAGEFKKLRQTVQALVPDPPDSELHAVRIKVRRARYAAELAEVAVGRPATRFIERAKTLQQILGQHQDAVVAEDRLRRLISRAGGKRAVFAAGLIVERLRAHGRASRAAFHDLWTKLQKRGRKAWG
ncbi:MAG: CHAD domain-containing protein, partial [Nitrospiraceae bacterium]